MIQGNKIIRKIHLWLGLTCGLLASFSGLTGALYVWQPEITGVLNPELLQVENKTDLEAIDFSKTAANLIEIHQDSIDKVYLPYREQQTISILFKNGETAFYNPSNGVFLGGKSNSILFFENLLQLHRTLGIPVIGKYVMGTSAIIFFFMILFSGFFIWWKAYGTSLKDGLKIKFKKKKKKKFNYDLHKVLGVGFFIPLFIMAFTGAYFTYNSYYKKGLSVLDSKAPTAQESKIGHSLSFKAALANADTDYALRAIYFPKNSTEDYKFRYVENRFITAGLRRTKEMQLSTSENITAFSDYRFDTVSNQIAAQFYPVHIGEIAGLFGRILVFISGFIPITLYITGFKIYRSKKKRKKIK